MKFTRVFKSIDEQKQVLDKAEYDILSCIIDEDLKTYGLLLQNYKPVEPHIFIPQPTDPFTIHYRTLSGQEVPELSMNNYGVVRECYVMPPSNGGGASTNNRVNTDKLGKFVNQVDFCIDGPVLHSEYVEDGDYWAVTFGHVEGMNSGGYMLMGAGSSTTQAGHIKYNVISHVFSYLEGTTVKETSFSDMVRGNTDICEIAFPNVDADWFNSLELSIKEDIGNMWNDGSFLILDRINNLSKLSYYVETFFQSEPLISQDANFTLEYTIEDMPKKLEFYAPKNSYMYDMYEYAEGDTEQEKIEKIKNALEETLLGAWTQSYAELGVEVSITKES